MPDSSKKKQEDLSFNDRLSQIIERKEAEGKALKKMIEKLEEDSARKSNQNKRDANNSK